jgi:UDP-N-acetylglucosamine enolpyruvyl transferase
MMSKLQELEQWKEQQEYESRVSEAMKVVEQQVKDASEKYPDVPQDLAEQFLSSFAESDPENAVNLAYEAAQKWIAQIQQGMVTDKLAQPEAAEGGSRADGSPEDIKDFRAASAQALARLKESQ